MPAPPNALKKASKRRNWAAQVNAMVRPGPNADSRRMARAAAKANARAASAKTYVVHIKMGTDDTYKVKDPECPVKVVLDVEVGQNILFEAAISRSLFKHTSSWIPSYNREDIRIVDRILLPYTQIKMVPEDGREAFVISPQTTSEVQHPLKLSLVYRNPVASSKTIREGPPKPTIQIEMFVRPAAKDAH